MNSAGPRSTTAIWCLHFRQPTLWAWLRWVEWWIGWARVLATLSQWFFGVWLPWHMRSEARLAASSWRAQRWDLGRQGFSPPALKQSPNGFQNASGPWPREYSTRVQM